ncbi:uncharacterized protein [Elaeis guineensis]|uniref:uncharacterized protein isoform X2 n=1 Tax=Elaeis guineensis var. tenera TaxID=51953 RepID=UPI003C6D5D02
MRWECGPPFLKSTSLKIVPRHRDDENILECNKASCLSLVMIWWLLLLYMACRSCPGSAISRPSSRKCYWMPCLSLQVCNKHLHRNISMRISEGTILISSSGIKSGEDKFDR